MHNVDKNIVFYDGDCLLCSKLVKILLRIDKKRALRFSLVQGDFIKKVASQDYIKNVDSILFWDGNNLTHSSTAIIRIMLAINMPKPLIWFIKIFPPSFRDYIYKLIANNRYKWFGKNKECFILQGEEAKRFLG